MEYPKAAEKMAEELDRRAIKLNVGFCSESTTIRPGQTTVAFVVFGREQVYRNGWVGCTGVSRDGPSSVDCKLTRHYRVLFQGSYDIKSLCRWNTVETTRAR